MISDLRCPIVIFILLFSCSLFSQERDKIYIKIKKDNSKSENNLTNLSVENNQLIEIFICDKNGNLIQQFPKINSESIKINISGMKFITDTLQTRSLSYSFKNALNNKDENISILFNPDAIGSSIINLPISSFTNGVAKLFLQDKRAYDTLKIQIIPVDDTILSVDKDQVIYISILAGEPNNIYTQVNPRKGVNTVFLLKPFEIVMQPRDIYNNFISDWKRIRFWRQIDPIDAIDDRVTGYVDLFRVDVNGNWLDQSPAHYPHPNGKYFIYFTPYIVHDRMNINSLKFSGSIINSDNGLVIPYSGNIVQILVVDHIPYMRVSDTNSFLVKNNAGNTVGDAPANPLTLKMNSDLWMFSWIAAGDTNDSNYAKTDGSNGVLADKCIVQYTLKFKEYPIVSFTNVDTLKKSTSISLSASGLKDAMKYVLGRPPKLGEIITLNWFLIFEDQTYNYNSPLYSSKLTSPSKILYLQNAGISDVDDKLHIPTVFGLDQNYPNPFNPTTTISYQLPKESNVKLVVYNILGQPVRTLIDDRQSADYYTIIWDGKNENGFRVSSGLYIYRLTADDFISAMKMSLLK